MNIHLAQMTNQPLEKHVSLDVNFVGVLPKPIGSLPLLLSTFAGQIWDGAQGEYPRPWMKGQGLSGLSMDGQGLNS